MPSLTSNMCKLVTIPSPSFFFFFFNDTATTEIYTLSLHDALPISGLRRWGNHQSRRTRRPRRESWRSEEHTSELQSRPYLVCRLLLEKKKKKRESYTHRCQCDSRWKKTICETD